MKFRSRKLAFLLLLLVAQASRLCPVAVAQPSTGGSGAGVSPVVDEAAYKGVSDKLICQCGCNYGLSWCPHLNCPSAPIIRQAIREKLATGQSEEQVLQAMVAQFGPAILAAPPAKGFDLAAWVMPGVAFLFGLALVVYFLRRWRARVPAPVADPALLDPALRDSVEREMKRLEE